MALLDFSFGVRKNALGAAAVPLKCDPLTLPVKLGGLAEGLWNLSGKIYRDETRTAAAHPFVLSLPSLLPTCWQTTAADQTSACYCQPRPRLRASGRGNVGCSPILYAL